jgi:tetratricopeptide (TPR) repeat protein
MRKASRFALILSSVFLLGASRNEQQRFFCVDFECPRTLRKAIPEKGDYQNRQSHKTAPQELKSAKEWIVKGIANHGGGHFDQAILDFEKAIALDPKSAEAFQGRGSANFRKGNLEKALADFNRAIELDQTLADAYVGRSGCHIKMNQLELAQADLDEAFRLSPKSVAALLNQAALFQLRKQPEKAIITYRTVLAIDNTIPPAQYEYARLSKAIFWDVDFGGEQWKYWGGGLAQPNNAGLLGVFLPAGQSQANWNEVLEQEYLWPSKSSLQDFLNKFSERIKDQFPQPD